MRKLLSLCTALLLLGVFSVQAQDGPQAASQATTVSAPSFNNSSAVLYDQLDNQGGVGVASQRFPDFGNSVLQSADDFGIPGGETWAIDGVNTPGAYFNGVGPTPLVDVIFYEDTAGLPGAPACIYPDLASFSDDGLGNLDIDLPVPCVLPSGVYWVSVMAVMEFGVDGQWGWIDRVVQDGNPAAWQDPDGLTGNPCTVWGVMLDCIGFGPDLAFQLEGELDGGGGECDGANVTMVDNFGGEWCWNGVIGDGVTGPEDLVCSGQGVAMDGTHLNAFPTPSSTTAAVCRNERLFEADIINPDPDGCTQNPDLFIFDGARKGILTYAGIFRALCNDGSELFSNEWSGTFDQSVRAPQRRGSVYMKAQRAERRAERRAARTDRVRKGDVEAPATFALEQNYPNPFNPSTQVRFALAEASNVSLRVYNLLGQEVAVLASGRMEAGRHEVQFDASQLTAGVYLYVLEAGDFTATKRLTLLK